MPEHTPHCTLEDIMDRYTHEWTRRWRCVSDCPAQEAQNGATAP